MQFVNLLHHPTLPSMVPRQNPRDRVLATPSSTAASLMLLQRPLAGGEDHKLIHDFEILYMQLKAVKDNIVEAGDGRSTKEYFGRLGTCSVSAYPLCLTSILIFPLLDFFVEQLSHMAQFAPCGWALSEYKDLSDWSLELANIKSSMLEKHRTTLLNMTEMMRDLGTLLEAEEFVAEEVALSVSTCSKRKGHKPKVVEEPEEEKHYDPPVHHAIIFFYKYY